MGEKERQYALLGFALLFALLAGFNFLYLNPLRDERERVAAQLGLLQKRIETQMVQAPKQAEEVPNEKLARIEEAIPVKPYTDQLIKDLEKLQTISRVEIVSATFAEQKQLTAKDIAEKFIPKEISDEQSKQGGQAAASNEAVQNTADQTASPKEESSTQASPSEAPQAAKDHSATDAPKNEETSKDLPPTAELLQQILPEANLSSVEITLTIKGEYKDIYDFATEIQRMSRYLRIDELTFATTEKDDFIIPKETKMTATVRLTSYFAPQFKSLLSKLPPVGVEGPSGKWDPLRYEVLPHPDN